MTCISGISCPNGRIDPSGEKWLITYQSGHCVGANFEWTCTTDVPIVLFAYVSTKPPWKKRGTHTKRGVVSRHDAEVYWNYEFIKCQEEVEACTVHTFTWPFYPDNQVFWWRCGGLTPGVFPQWSASRSPFWNFKCAAPAYECTTRVYADSNAVQLREWNTDCPPDVPPNDVYSDNPADACSYGAIGNNIQYCHDKRRTKKRWHIRRGFGRFDTSVLPDDAVIKAATLHVYLAGNFIGDPTPPLWQGGAIALVHVTEHPDPWACDTSLWNATSTMADIMAIKSLPVPSAGFYDIPFETDALHYIHTTQYTYLLARCVNDILHTSTPFWPAEIGATGSVLLFGGSCYLDITYDTSQECP